MKIEIAHKLKPADAKARMKELGAYWEKKYGIKPSWTKDSAKVAGSIMGFKFDAVMEVAKAAVTLEGPDPNFLIRGKVTGYLEHKMKEYLDAKNTLEDLVAKREEIEK